MGKYVIELENVTKRYRLYNDKRDRLIEALNPLKRKLHKEFYAVRDLNLKIKKGEILGILGRNGSGKSTFLKLASGVLTPTRGTVRSEGTIIPLLELGSVFNKDFTGLDNIYFYCIILGFSKEMIAQKKQEIIEFSELGEFIYQPVKSYSSGMKSRLAFSVAMMIDPDILMLDEVLSVGDEAFKEKSFAKMKEFFDSGKTILYVTHSSTSVEDLCTRVIMLDKGRIILDDRRPEVVTAFYKKYWRASDEVKLEMKKEVGITEW